MVNIVLRVRETVPAVQETVGAAGINWWMLIAAVEFILIIALLSLRKDKNSDRKTIYKEEALKGTVDFKNIVDSSFNATKLYGEMIRKCHPDRFIGDERKVEVANRLSAEISDNKNNIKRLEELRIEAREKLEIDI